MLDSKGLASKVNETAPTDVIDPTEIEAIVASVKRDATSGLSMQSNPMSFAAPEAANDNAAEMDDIIADIARESTQQQVVDGILTLIDEEEGMIEATKQAGDNMVKHLESVESALDRMIGVLMSGFGTLGNVSKDQFDVQSEMVDEQRHQAAAIEAGPSLADQLGEETSSIMEELGSQLKATIDRMKDQLIAAILHGSQESFLDTLIEKGIAIATALISVGAALAPTLDLFSRDGVFSAYLDAFKNTWDALSFEFGKITTELTEWWNGGGSADITKIGAFINDTVIYYIGTILPALIRGISEIVISLVENVSKFVSGLTDVIRGYLTLDSKLVSEGYKAMIEATLKFATDLVDQLVTFVLRLTGLDVMLGMGEDQTFMQKIVESVYAAMDYISNLFVETFNGLKDLIFDPAMKYLNELFQMDGLSALKSIGGLYLSLIDEIYTFFVRFFAVDQLIGMKSDQTLFEFISQKIQDIIQVILDMIPTKKDMADYINRTIDGWNMPDWASSLLKIDTTGMQTQVTPTPDQVERLRRLDQSTPTNPNSPMAGVPTSADGPAPVVVMDNSTRNNIMTGGGGGGGGRGGSSPTPSTRAEPSGMDRILMGNTDSFRSR